MADRPTSTGSRRGDTARGGGASRGKAVVRVHPEVESRGGIVKFVASYEGSLARVVPTHVSPEAFVALAVAYVNRDAKLREAATANPAALMLALRECAVLGHMPVPKIYALVPFRDNSDNNVGGWAISGIETYHGVIERMYRSGAIQSIRCNIVRERDEFGWDALSQTVTKHGMDPRLSDEDRGPKIGVYAYAVMLAGGLSRAVWLNAAEVAKHRAMSKSKDGQFWGGPWDDSMWLKTGCHALEPWVPTSAEYRAAMAQSEAAATKYLDTSAAAVAQSNPPPVPQRDYVDADVVADPPTAPYGPSDDDTGASDDDSDQVDPMGGADPDNDPPAPTASQTGWPDTASPGSGAVPKEGTS